MFFRKLVEWVKRGVLETAAKELFAEMQTAEAVVTDPPVLALAVESAPALTEEGPTEEPTGKARGRKKVPAKKK